MKKSIIFVFIQLLCIVLLFWQYGLYCHNYWISLQLLAVGIALSAIWQFSWPQLSITAVPKQKGLMIKSGPYQYIRHPMYLSVLLYFTAFLLNDLNVFSLVVYLILVIDLLLKMNYEEKLLKEKYVDYSDYCKGSKKLLPFIY